MTQPTSATSVWRTHLPLVLVAIVAITGAILLRDHLTFEALRDNHDALLAFRDRHYALTALLFISAYFSIVAFSLPGALAASLTGGFLFGLFPGALFNLASATLGALAIFLIVRAGLGQALTTRIDASDGRIKRLSVAIRENEFQVLLSLRLLPVLPFFVMNVLPALIGMRTTTFVAATFLGIIPGGLIYTWVGAGLGEVFARGETPNLGIIFEPQFLAPIIGLAILSVLPVIIRKYWKKEGV